MNTEMLVALGMAAVAYLIGSFSPSTLMAKAKGVDIKKEGSGNAGTTNTLRVLGPKAAIITLIIDILKGVFAVYLGSYVGGAFGEFVANQTAYLCAAGVVCGHIWPVYFKFKGGKGIATAFGALLAVNAVLALSALGVAAIGMLVSKRVSVGSILAAILLAPLTYYFEYNFMLGATFLSCLVIYTHRENIVRIRKGQEPKLSFGKKKK